MGNAASIDSIKSYESEVSRIGEKPLDKKQLEGIFGDVANMTLFDLLKDERSGKVFPSELREIIKARRRMAESRRNKEIVVTPGAGSKERELLIKTLAEKDQNLKKVISDRAAFQQRICSDYTKGAGGLSESKLKENAEKLAEFEKLEEQCVREHKEAAENFAGLRREEVAKAVQERAERMAKVHDQIKGKTGFSFIAGSGGGGGGGHHGHGSTQMGRSGQVWEPRSTVRRRGADQDEGEATQ